MYNARKCTFISQPDSGLQLGCSIAAHLTSALLVPAAFSRCRLADEQPDGRPSEWTAKKQLFITKDIVI